MSDNDNRLHSNTIVRETNGIVHLQNYVDVAFVSTVINCVNSSEPALCVTNYFGDKNRNGESHESECHGLDDRFIPDIEPAKIDR